MASVGGMAQSPHGAGAEFVEDEVSFTAPRLQAIADCIADFRRASEVVKGAEARVKAATDAWKDLEAFMSEIQRLLEGRAFQTLPKLKQGQDRLDGFHHLTIGPWRGIFLVSPDGAYVAGLVFSREPHELGPRLLEVAGAYQKAAKPETEEAKTDDGDE
jgi:hypothetical protein